ncbi:MAG: hypothetical protein AB1445_08055 [Bacillota bacterium]
MPRFLIRPPRPWSQLTWEEKMAVWRWHRLVDVTLGLLTFAALFTAIVVCLGVVSGKWPGRWEIWAVLGAVVVVSLCVAITFRLMNAESKWGDD